ncbi:hypothetical protein PR048_006405 [Dryococelus australis]|uniref:Uncharacterized protein n=1 Tax=Dryococelus australis TaxID=614101 RepID=A0ABQ9IAW0_9NEOP|nr:hypothetical protein PR048_006405 [Dryococelus australis]
MPILISESPNTSHDSAQCKHGSLLVNKKEEKLPTITPPTFGGEVTQFLHFYDTVSCLIVNNDSLDNIKKFHYLLNSFTSDDHKVIENLPVGGDNFQIAWNVICSSTSKTFAKLATCKQVDNRRIHLFVNQVTSNLNAIRAIDIKIPLHELLMSQMMLEKLDATTRKEWELYSSPQKFSTCDELLTFLEIRSKAIELMQPTQAIKLEISD